MKQVIKADKFFLKNRETEAGYLIIRDGLFDIFCEREPEKYDQLLDYTGYWIGPGLVDTHIHGYNGNDIMDNNANGFKQMSVDLLSCGVTSFLPTTLTSSIESLNEVVQTIGEHINEVEGAKAKGIFLEGPFFTEKHKGAQNPGYFMDPSIDILKKWQELSQNTIVKIAIAPEREGTKAFIEYAASQQIKVAIAHTDATYEIATEAVKTGASIFTHTFNGMNGLHHREPGAVGAAMTVPNAYAEIICDGNHVHPVAANILMNQRGRDETILISDCMMAGGKPDGQYMLGEFEVFVEDGMAKIDTGSLAGSILKLKDAVKNVVDWGIATPAEAIKMASQIPCESIGLSDCGYIEKGIAADFIVLDKELDLQATFVNGVRRYVRE
ncbi:N-acetylglucosamine-6-phosphate deacetylase [Lacticigenium naphthae]|uniref:N-acetylglucosamine-6-phosphate deacetylase n=1 Tax=Lacticigenium naphthae TaxID=515351 RepID=UPI00040A933E|nr:N-acetylglucosamine-6-phosphate deacetylase [Lacticigenium naphthae]